MRWNIVRENRVTSTQEVAREYALTGNAEGTVIVAKTQTDGRGRHGRKWYSPEGGLYMTAVLKPIKRAGLVPILGGVVVAEAIEAVTGIVAELKWPNDTLIRGRKVGGVIADSGWLHNEPRYTLLGIGVNVNNPLIETLPEATTLSEELGEEVDVERLLHQLIDMMDFHLAQLDDEPDRILQSWRSLTEMFGKHVEVTDSSGKIVRGLAVDVDSEGALVLEECGKRRRVVSGVIEGRYS